MPIYRLCNLLMLSAGLLTALFWGLHSTMSSPVAAELQQAATVPLATAVLTATKDNTLYEGTSDLTSNGAGPYLFAGRNAQGSTRRGLLAFAIAGRVPASSTIVSVTLRLQMVQTRGGATPVKLHRVTADWGEGASNSGSSGGQGAPAQTSDATWLHAFFDTDLWSAQGGDFVETASATTTVAGPAAYTWSDPALVADVQNWLDNPATNFGWIIIGAESGNQTAKKFASRENNLAANRPQLTITYLGPAGEERQLFLPLVQN
jgi:hypothetical protein